MAVFPGLNAGFGSLAALLWGGGDFAGSLAVKRQGSSARGALLVVMVGHLASLAVVVLIAHLRGEAILPNIHLWWGVAGGAVSAISLVGFYVALASGHMGSAAAISGLLCALVPAVVSGFLEGAPGWRRVLGFALAGAAIWLIASAASSETRGARRSTVLAALSGLGFGAYFVSLKFAGADGVLWGMAASRLGSTATAALLFALLTSMHRTERVAAPIGWPLTIGWILLGAALDTGGNLSFLAATRVGRLDVAAVLASLYPAATILLAAVLLKESMTARQRYGMLLALPAVVLITL